MLREADNMLVDRTQEMINRQNLQKSSGVTFHGRCKEIRALKGNNGKGDAVQVPDQQNYPYRF